MERTASFGYWVRRRRKALDLTQEELARQVGCAEVTIKKIEADERRPSRQIAERLAASLQLAPAERAAFVQAARGELATDRLDLPLPPPPPAPAVALLPGGTLTFLFTDIEASARLWEQHPQAMSATLVRHDALLRDVIEAHGGYIFKHTGDGVLAAFTTASHALSAALEAQRAVQAENWGSIGPIRVRMALHTGVAEVRDGDYYGVPLNRTARLLTAGHGGQVLLSHATADLLRDMLPANVTLRDLGEYRLKDLTRPEQIFQPTVPHLPTRFPPLRAPATQSTEGLELLLRPASSTAEGAAVDTLDGSVDETIESQADIFVAREHALNRLDSLLHAALAGHGQIVFVTGDAGSGKTSLLLEFARRAVQLHADLVVAAGNCNAHTGAGDPYLPFREVLDLLTGNVEVRSTSSFRAPPFARRLRVLSASTIPALLEIGPALIDTFVPGPDLLARANSVAPGANGWRERLAQVVAQRRYVVDTPSPDNQHEIFAQFTRVVTTIARRQPLLFVLDDLQWADTASVGLLFHLSRRIENSRILIVGAYRPADVALGRGAERHPLDPVINELRRYHGDIEVNLDQTIEEEGRQFIDAVLDRVPNRLGPKFRSDLFEQTGGHPLFTLELLRDLQARGGLVRDETGRWVVGPELDWTALPTRLEGVIAERISRLPEELQEALSIASIEGETFTAEVVARTQKVDARGLVRRFSGALDRQQRLVQSQGTRRMGEHRLSTYRFRHILFQKYLYARLSEGERAYLHEDVGTALERLAAGQTEAIAAQLARHFELAGCTEKAVTYLLQVGERARRLYANEEALVALSRALALLATAPLDESQVKWKQHRAVRYAVLLAREQVYGLQGEHAAEVADLAALEGLAEGMGDSARQAEVALRWSWYHERTSDYRTLVEAARRALDLASGDLSRAAEARLRWGRGLLLQSDYTGAQAQLAVALELAQAAGAQQVELYALRFLGVVASDQSDHRAARAYFEHALAIARAIGDRQGEARVLYNLGTVALEQSDYLAARAYFEHALAIARAIADQSMQGTVLGLMGEVARAQGDYGVAHAYSEQAVEIARAIGDRTGEGWALSNLAEVAWGQGDYEAARVYAEQAVAIARAIGSRFLTGWALISLGHALTSLGRLADASATFGEAAELHRTLGQAHLAAGSRTGLARAQLAQGDLAGALAQVEQVLAYLATGSLNGAAEPARAYLACVEVLQAAGDARSRPLLARAYAELQDQAARMDESARRLFLDNVPHHRTLVTTWAGERQP